ncbi:MAG: RNA polymerase subunit sigma-70 [Rhodopirellula sp. TMED11]|nr:MAG: RNA polymerase subunit sigma-70 [Rhodopirellula sp. TMED11]
MNDAGRNRPSNPQAATRERSPVVLPPRRPRWMSSAELEEALRFAQNRSSVSVDCDRPELVRLTKQFLRRETAFISHPAHNNPSAGKEIFSTPLDLQGSAKGSKSRVPKSVADMPIHFGRMCQTTLLTPDQERMLFQRMNYLLQQAEAHRRQLNPSRPSRVRLEVIDQLIAMAEWHRDRLVEANLRLVFSIVKKFVNPNHTFEELLSDGIVALIRAVEKFDFDRGFRFSTYATQVIRRNAYRTVVTQQQERQKTIGGFQDMDLDVTEETRESAISEKRWHELRSRLNRMLSLLDRRERFIIRTRFSLGPHRKVYTLQYLAQRLGVSKERVRQLERRAMDKLRTMVDDAALGDLDLAI